MVLLIATIIYLIGIPISFLLMGGHTDFTPDEDETQAETEERYFSIFASVAMALAWPIFWALVIFVYIIAHILPRFLS